MTTGEKPKILIVDDQPRNLDVLEAMLDDLDCTLIRATSADEALLALVRHEFAALVLDIKMPGMSGIELAALIKQRKRSQHVPILFLTAHSVQRRRRAARLRRRGRRLSQQTDQRGDPSIEDWRLHRPVPQDAGAGPAERRLATRNWRTGEGAGRVAARQCRSRAPRPGTHLGVESCAPGRPRERRATPDGARRGAECGVGMASGVEPDALVHRPRSAVWLSEGLIRARAAYPADRSSGRQSADRRGDGHRAGDRLVRVAVSRGAPGWRRRLDQGARPPVF